MAEVTATPGAWVHDFSRGDVSSSYGMIHVQWEIKDGKLQKSCRLPKGMTLLEGEEV